MKKKYIESTTLIALIPILTIILIYGVYTTKINYKITKNML